MNGLVKACLSLKEGLDINIKACKEVFMILTKDQEEILQGKNGDTMAKVMETMIRYGELFNADKMVPITSEYHHFVTSFGLKAMTSIYDLLDFLIEENALPKKKFSVDPFEYNLIYLQKYREKGAEIHPGTLRYLRELGHDTRALGLE